MFSEHLEKKGRDEAFRFAGQFITAMTLLTGALTLVGMIFPQPLVALFGITEEKQFRMQSTNGKILLVHSSMISAKSTRDSQGVQVMTLRKNHRVDSVKESDGAEFVNPKRYRSKNIPAAGATLAAEDAGEQLSLL